MFKHSVIKSTNMKSPLEGQAVLRPKNTMTRRSLMTGVALTSLVDAFSILVIYLLINASAADKSIRLENGVDLPQASQATTLELGTIVRLSDGKYFVNDQEVRSQDLPGTLYEIQQHALSEGRTPSLIVEAEKDSDFAAINPIIVSSAMSGFSKIKLAVIRSGGPK